MQPMPYHMLYGTTVNIIVKGQTLVDAALNTIFIACTMNNAILINDKSIIRDSVLM